MKLLKRVLSVAASFTLSAMIFTGIGKNTDTIYAAGNMRDMTSQEIVSDMGLGWNLGNTFDSYYSGQTLSASKVETAWGNPTVQKELIQSIKNQGFETVRIPVTWMNCIDSSNNIDSAFLDRVQTVVDYCIDEGLYVILNMHHDGGDDGWIRNAGSDYASTSAKYEALWKQIAARFADYSDFLIFESMNEVTYSGYNSPSAANYTTLNNLNQLFVDTIRSSGSNNEKRHLLIAGYFTDVDCTVDSRFKMPNDSAGRCIVSVHYYTPSSFCVATPGTSWGYATTWGTSSEQSTLESNLDKLTNRFVSAGVPVIIGEYGVLTESSNGKETDSIIKYLGAVAEGALTRGICPVLWDSGNSGDMKFFNRSSYSWNISELGSVYAALAEEYAEGFTPPVTTDPDADSVTVKLSTNSDGTKYIDLSPYAGRTITGVGFTLNGSTYSGNGGVMIGFNVYDSSSSWGGSWKGVQATFEGSQIGSLIEYTFDPSNSDSVDPTQIMYTGQTMTFSMSWTYPSNYKDTLTLSDEITLYFGEVETPTVKMGDVNQDDNIDVFDAVAVAQYTVGKKTLTAEQLLAADMNSSGSVDVFDAIAIAKMTV